MSITKTLGGDRLGAGKKQQVHMHGFERSTHDKSYTWRSTMAAGTLVPFMKELGLPGDTFDINLGCEILTHPTVGPLFGSHKVQLDVFQCPIRLYQGDLHNNKLGIGMKMSEIKLPAYSLATSTVTPDQYGNIDNTQINPSCLLSYLGHRGVGISTEKTLRTFNGVPLLAYWDIYKQYYSNKQEEVGAVIHNPLETVPDNVTKVEVSQYAGAPLTLVPKTTPGVPITITKDMYVAITHTGGLGATNPSHISFITTRGIVSATDLFNRAEFTENGAGSVVQAIGVDPLYINSSILAWDYTNPFLIPQDGEPKVHFFPLENIDTMREEILKMTGDPAGFGINAVNIEPYSLLLNEVGTEPNVYRSRLSSQEGLAIKTYQSDLFNNWISTDWIDGPNGINAITAIDTSGGGFEIPTLILARKVYDMLNRIAVSGGTYDDWLDVQWGHERYTRCESPMYMGGLIKELVFQEVVSNSASTAEGTAQPLGTLAGRGRMAAKHKGGSITIKVDEPSYIIAICSITPRLDYSQGNDHDIHLRTMDDFHKPMLDQIGFQELITEQMHWADTYYDTTADKWVTRSAGKQPAWINYMTNVNQVRGNFAVEGNEMFMTLNRKYEWDKTTGQIKDLTTYIDPVKFNHIFAQTTRDAQNFWVQIGVDMIARRKMSAKQMPNL